MPLWSTPHDDGEHVYECRRCDRRVQTEHAPQECAACGGPMRAVHAANAE